MIPEDLKMCFKVVVSGDVVEVYEYKNPVTVGKSRDYDIVRADNTVVDEPLEKREGNLFRSRKTVRELIWCNQTEYTKFVTLTYAKCTLDIKKVRNDVATFTKAMRRLGYDMKYLYVLENQKKRGLKEGNEGSLHIHMIIFIDKYIPYKDINKAWKHGQTDIHAIHKRDRGKELGLSPQNTATATSSVQPVAEREKGSGLGQSPKKEKIENLGAYLCKYITKDNFAEFGKKCYACSLGLNRPKEERFYTVGCSDSSWGEIKPSDVFNSLNITYNAINKYDFIMPSGEGAHQEVRYYQGRWKGENIIEKAGPLNDFKRQIDDLRL